MNRLLSPVVADLLPYVPGEQPREPVEIKLNTNEHSYGPSPRVLEALHAAVNDDLRLYPDPMALELRQAIADSHGLEPGQVFVGNGSDEVLAHIFKALFAREGVLLMPDITYSFYRSYSRFFGIEPKLIPLADDFSIRISDYTDIQNTVLAGIILANPNAPTGRALELADIARLASAHPDVPIVIDEAYVDFGADSASALLASHDNLVVVQTLSKSRALAGLRVGYSLSDASIVDGLERVKNSFNSYPLDQLAQAGAIAALKDVDYTRKICEAVITTRDALAQKLLALGFEVQPSKTNFLFVQHPNREAASLAADLRKKGILVRYFDQPRINNYLRITVGTPNECHRLCEVLNDLLGG